MTDLEIQEQAEKMYREYPTEPKGETRYNKDINCFKKRKAFIAGAKWMQEQDEWIPLPSKELFPSGYYAIRISHNGFVHVKFEFIYNQIIPYHYATHYYPVALPSPPKTK